MQCGYIVHWSKMRCKVKPPEENSLRTAKGDISSWTISAITRQSIELERCSNHLQIRQQSTASFDWKTIFQFWFWGSLWVTSQMGMFLRFFGWVYLARESNPQCHCLTQSCFGIYDSIRVFRALNWLSNICGAKIRPKNITPRAMTGHNSPVNWVSELFKPSKDSWSLVICNKKIIKDFNGGFSVDVYMITARLCIFCLHSDDVIIPWEPIKRVGFVAQRILNFGL